MVNYDPSQAQERGYDKTGNQLLQPNGSRRVHRTGGSASLGTAHEASILFILIVEVFSS